MRLRQTYDNVHVPEVLETPGALIVELGKRRDEAIAFSGGQLVGVLANANHDWSRSNQRSACTGLDRHVAIIQARFSETTGNEKRNGASIHGYRKRHAIRKCAVVPLRKTTSPPPATDLPVICTLTVGVVAPAGW
jgi:hypothetical protein